MGTVTRKSNYTPVVKFRTKPFKHQRQCLAGYGMREFFALLAEPGTGKTWIIINNIAELWTKHVCDAALVFAPTLAYALHPFESETCRIGDDIFRFRHGFK